MRFIFWGIAVCALGGCNESGDMITDAGADAPLGNPLEEIDTSTITPANGTIVGPEDDPLHVSLQTPGIIPGYSGTVPTTVDVTAMATGDRATLSDTTDDWVEEVFSNTGVDLDQITAGSIDLASASGGGPVNGERIELAFTVSSVRPSGTYTREASVTVTYQDF